MDLYWIGFGTGTVLTTTTTTLFVFDSGQSLLIPLARFPHCISLDWFFGVCFHFCLQSISIHVHRRWHGHGQISLLSFLVRNPPQLIIYLIYYLTTQYLRPAQSCPIISPPQNHIRSSTSCSALCIPCLDLRRFTSPNLTPSTFTHAAHPPIQSFSHKENAGY